MKQNNVSRRIETLDLIFLYAVGIFSLGYTVYCRSFAKLHLEIPFIGVPLFVGEVLLGIGFILLFLRWRISPPIKHKAYIFIGIYFCWIALKTISGYIEMGPLALRNAALFYYAAFGLLGFTFFRLEFFQRNRQLTLLILFLVPLTVGFNGYYLFPYAALALSLILAKPSLMGRVSWLWLAGLLLIYPFPLFFKDSKNVVVGNMAAFTFLLFSIYLLVLDRLPKKIRKWTPAALLTILVLLTLGFFRFAEGAKIKTMSNPFLIAKLFKEYDRFVEEQKPYYRSEKLFYKLYNDQRDTSEKLFYQIGVSKEEPPPVMPFTTTAQYFFPGNVDLESLDNALGLVERKLNYAVRRDVLYNVQKSLGEKRFAPSITPPATVADIEKSKNLLKKIQQMDSAKGENPTIVVEQKVKMIKEAVPVIERLESADPNNISLQGRSVDTDYANIMFRLLIWRDMLVELKEEKPLFGVSFAKPQRSISIEVLNMAVGEWSRDGWIMPHNSYLNFIYRGGIVGLAVIGFLIWCLFVLAKFFITIKSGPGIILTSIIVYWMTIANFTVCFEFPYHAIPFWTLLGMLFAYKKHLEKVT
jgi:hypothetical protein